MFEHVHLPKEKHDYGPSKRQAMYPFMAKHLNLDFSPFMKDGKVDESSVTEETREQMLVFGKDNPFPKNAVKANSKLPD